MDAVRVRRGFSLEVLAAAAFLLATVLVGTLILRELRTVRPAPPAGQELQAVPSGVPDTRHLGAGAAPARRERSARGR